MFTSWFIHCSHVLLEKLWWSEIFLDVGDCNNAPHVLIAWCLVQECSSTLGMLQCCFTLATKRTKSMINTCAHIKLLLLDPCTFCLILNKLFFDTYHPPKHYYRPHTPNDSAPPTGNPDRPQILQEWLKQHDAHYFRYLSSHYFDSLR